jgi:glutamyl-tRNA reductase
MPAVRPAPQPFAVGATHRSSALALRDRLFIDESAAPDFYRRLKDAGIAEAVMLSTCDRVEVQGMSETPDAAIAAVREIMAARAGENPAALAAQLEAMTGEEAVRRIFAVAASLESQVVGESQVLGQVKEGHRLAARHGMVGPALEGLMQAAYATAKRVRTETEIGERPVTLASGAVQIARDLHGDLSDVVGLIVGLGDMGDLIGGQLRLAGVDRTILTGPSRRTEAQARRMGCNFMPFDQLEDALVDADIVVTAAGTGRFLITADVMERALRRRKRRPVLILDGGIPADVEPAVDELDGAFVYTLDDLERVAREGRANREAAAAHAWKIVDAELERWRRSVAERDAVPMLVSLRANFEAIRDEILAADPDADAAEATRRLVNRLLHTPSEALRRLAAETGCESEKRVAGHIVARLFGLPDLAEGVDEDDEEAD